MKIKLILLLTAGVLSGCARQCESFERDFQPGKRHYRIEQYSGGQLIKIYEFDGIINNQDNSDGYYFTVNDTLFEIGGDIIIKSTK